MFISSGESKQRSLPGPTFFVKNVAFFTPGVPTTLVNDKASTGGIQITESDGNRWPPPKRGELVDCGSEFYTQKQEILPMQFPHHSLFFKGVPGSWVDTDQQVTGSFYVANAFGSTAALAASSHDMRLLKPNWPTDQSSSRSALNVKGQIAVAQTAPTNQVANAASFVGEALQDLPALPGVSLWKSRLRAAEVAAAGAGEFLNGVFGILPTYSDMVTFYKGVHVIDKYVDQVIRDAGRPVRRTFVFPKERTITETELAERSPAGYSGSSNNFYAGPAKCLPVYKTIRTRVIEREIWFSGAFTYHLPDWFDASSRSDRMKLTAKLLGAEPNLDTLWQLAPWSWAVDWTVNAGSWIKSLQSLISYGTVLRYGYVMEKTIVTDTFSAGDVTFIPGSDGTNSRQSFLGAYPRPAPVVLRVTTKKRIQANPFGFGISWDGLTSVQQAIVAALGITRVVR